MKPRRKEPVGMTAVMVSVSLEGVLRGNGVGGTAQEAKEQEYQPQGSAQHQGFEKEVSPL